MFLFVFSNVKSTSFLRMNNDTLSSMEHLSLLDGVDKMRFENLKNKKIEISFTNKVELKTSDDISFVGDTIIILEHYVQHCIKCGMPGIYVFSTKSDSVVLVKERTELTHKSKLSKFYNNIIKHIKENNCSIFDKLTNSGQYCPDEYGHVLFLTVLINTHDTCIVKKWELCYFQLDSLFDIEDYLKRKEKDPNLYDEDIEIDIKELYMYIP